jgi:hypothetical protein
LEKPGENILDRSTVQARNGGGKEFGVSRRISSYTSEAWSHGRVALDLELAQSRAHMDSEEECGGSLRSTLT